MVLLLLVLAGTAAGASCYVPTYDSDALEQDNRKTERLFLDLELYEARTQLQHTLNSLPCIKEVPKRAELAFFGRMMSLSAFYNQDHNVTIAWGLMARHAAPTLPPSIGSLPDTLATMLDETPDAMIGKLNRTIEVPEGGALFINGQLLLTPSAPAEVPHFMQVLDGNANLIHSYWQDGAAFPERLLGPPGVPPPPPEWSTEWPIVPLSEDRTFPVGVIPLAVGGGLLVGATATYLTAFAPKNAMEHATTREDLSSLRTQANTRVVASGVTAGVGVGAAVLGVVLITVQR
ncbi:MAG: hypothetical protein HN348_17835 [Proteobacteria bacterium]|nr:hypothetical protein [Pseudomonadota bacterium]